MVISASLTYDGDGDELDEPGRGGEATTYVYNDDDAVAQQSEVDLYGATVNWESFSYDEDSYETLTVNGDGTTTSDSYDDGNLTLETVLDSSVRAR